MATLCFDLDGTLCSTTGGEYERAEPIVWAIRRVNELARAGHKIVIFTARGTATGIDWHELTSAQLARWGVVYDELRFGKPSADVFIDDRAVHAVSWRAGGGFAPPGLTVEADTSSTGPWADLPVSSPPDSTTVVELGRTFRGRPLQLERHASRAQALAAAVGISGLPTRDEIAEAVLRALPEPVHAGDVAFTIRLSDAGPSSFADAGERAARARIRVDCRAIGELIAELAPMLTPGDEPAIRAGSEHDARDRWPLLREARTGITAGLGGRLCLVTDGALRLEPPGPVPNVAGRWLGDVATALGIGLTSDALSDADLSEAQEAFVIGMPYCVLPVASLEERSLELAPGPLTRRLIEAWSRRVGLDLLEQIAGSLSSGRTPPAVGGPRRREQVSSTIVIPARLRSSRLAEKVLAEIDGRTMIEHVYDVAVRAATGPVLVLTDSEAVEQVVRGFGGEVWMTGPEHESGTARIASVAQMLESDVVVNLQGDAPLIDPELVAEAVQQASSSSAAVTMPVYPIADPEQLRDPSVVKVVRAQDGRVLYCSRSVVPFFRDGGDDSGEAGSFWGHPGLYAYRREFLRTFHKLPASPLEGAERLEQLRWLEAGVRIHSFVTRPQHTSVDTAADLDEVRRAYADRVAS